MLGVNVAGGSMTLGQVGVGVSERVGVNERVGVSERVGDGKTTSPFGIL